MSRESLPAQAEQHLKRLREWVPAGDLADVLGVPSNQLVLILADALKQGRVERVRRGGTKLRIWRVTEKAFAPPPRSLAWPPGFVSQWDAVVARERQRG
jgi:hypothetical protein